MNISIQKKVFQKYPSFAVIFLLVKKINNRDHVQESQHLLQEQIRATRLLFHPESIKTHALVSPWAAAQAELGSKAKHYHTSVERLLQAVLQKKSILTRHTLLNVISYLSLKYVLPLGADDKHKIHGGIKFTLEDNTLLYRDEKIVLGTKLDYWKNNTTRVSAKTTTALIHIEALYPITPQKLELVAAEATQLLSTFCGAAITTALLHRAKPRATLK